MSKGRHIELQRFDRFGNLAFIEQQTIKNMTLIKSISGIRGTIGGQPGDNLTPIDMVKFTSAFVKFIQHSKGVQHPKVVVGRDARMSGFLVNQVVCGTLQAMGADVLDIGLSTTPTTEIFAGIGILSRRAMSST